MKTFRSFLTEETKNSVSQYLQEFEDAVVSTHERIERNGHTFFTPRTFDKKVPNKMIISALQGDEPAGWMGLLEFVKNNKPKNVNVTYVPIFSKETFESGEHEDDANETQTTIFRTIRQERQNAFLRCKNTGSRSPLEAS